ncbi:ArsR/SmtB family transcription factor [Streptomyces sp. AN091965]|uniref:ArsR/SmtB family transcription factor n=1 Tax=Streptomyces sp. AN091965 TaxID=2927803 RepID=UPI001F600ABD|nr:helix-turn-helix domain-containing protein [Streptomyces sp. AN091965]MCI3934426.1 helix-turn-helix domain-containing protein [Streptomyces sp. AN091965]
MADEHRILDPERDAAALKALTHPLRIRLLGLLRADGPATASELAVKTGESSASTSYHLRVLAKYGFVAEAEHRDGRERRWQSVHAVTSWNNADMDASPEGRAFRSSMARRQLDHLTRSLARHERDLDAGRFGPEWREHAGITDLMPRLTAASLAELWRAFEGKLAELSARDAADPDAEQVVVFAATLPVATPAPAEDGEPGLAEGGAAGASDGPDDPGAYGPDDTRGDEPDGPGGRGGSGTHRNVSWGVS